MLKLELIQHINDFRGQKRPKLPKKNRKTAKTRVVVSHCSRDTFNRLISLETLVLSNNRLTNIPSYSFKNLYKIGYLGLDGNQCEFPTQCQEFYDCGRHGNLDSEFNCEHPGRNKVAPLYFGHRVVTPPGHCALKLPQGYQH